MASEQSDDVGVESVGQQILFDKSVFHGKGSIESNFVSSKESIHCNSDLSDGKFSNDL